MSEENTEGILVAIAAVTIAVTFGLIGGCTKGESICYDLGRFAPSEKVAIYCDITLGEKSKYRNGVERGME